MRTITLDGRYLNHLTDLQRRYFLRDLFDLADQAGYVVRVKGMHWSRDEH